MRRPVGLFKAPEASGRHLALIADEVMVQVHEDLLHALGPGGGVIEVSLGAWGMTTIRLQRPRDAGDPDQPSPSG